MAVCDRDQRAPRARAAAHGVAGYRDLLAEGADVAVVALPHHLHCEVAVAALQAGCHVLVEKPLAVSVSVSVSVSVEQCRTMLQAASGAWYAGVEAPHHNVVNGIYNWREGPIIQRSPDGSVRLRPGIIHHTRGHPFTG